MEVIKAVKFKYHGDFDELFKDFRGMLEFCIDKALKLGITSYAKLRKAIMKNGSRNGILSITLITVIRLVK